MAKVSNIPAVDEGAKYECYHFYMGGFEQAEIAEKTGINPLTLKSWIHKDGWYQTREAIRAKAREKNPPEKSVLAKMLPPERAADNIRRFKEATNEIAAEDAEHWAELTPAKRIESAPAIASLNTVHRKNLELDKEEEKGKGGLINITFLTKPGVRMLDPSEVVEIEGKPEQ